MRDIISGELGASAAIISAVASDPALIAQIGEAAEVSIAALRRGNKLLLAGNGGSAADAQHLAAELVSRFAYDRPGLAAFALTTDTSALTAIGNDYGYEKLFARQVQAVGRPGDVFFGISTSGRSPNVLAAIAECRSLDIKTIGLTGMPGGALPAVTDLCIRVPSGETPKIQEGHIVIGHIICGLIERTMFPT